MSAFCARAQIDAACVFEAADDPQRLPFEECERRVRQELAEKDLELGSREHQETVEPRPRDPAVKPVFDAILKQYRFAISPLELLLAVIAADPVLAERLARCGFTSTTV